MPLSRRVARFNRLFANHVVGPLFTRMPGFGAIHHRGRRSRRAYRTPVKYFRRGDDYIITLPYGPDADWVRNVLAAGGCALSTRGRRLQLTAPVLFADDGSTPIPRLVRLAMTRLHSTTYLALRPGVPEGRSDV
ncbi:nitroreductase family deazaflavin-dependent oxidoreductase [Dactylosporangium sp. CA-139066]|uniref:nitroreductase family deazaflavin-dependent oxidoreductase n=1 Tax=Dactylosporangium sp. CA-139066 TaxID=3239930 RepID=UPI003D903EAD